MSRLRRFCPSRSAGPGRPFVLAIAAIVLSASLTTSLAAQQAVDEAYTAKIREYTTEPFFLTPMIDYLPASDTVPSPLDFLGHIAGAPDVLTYSHEAAAYMRAVAAASPRVEVFSMGQSEEGREMILVVAGSEEAIANLQRYKDITARLADPRRLSEEEAEQLVGEGKAFYWCTGALHSSEIGSPEMLIELVYRIAVDESEFIREIRDNVIFMATPVIEPDGRDKQVDLTMAANAETDEPVATRLLYWGKYVAHDNNRDNIGLSLALSRAVARTYLEYHAQVLHDLHESVSYLYISTGTGPYNAWLDPITIDEWHELAYNEVSTMTRLGVPGVWTHGFYDGWTPNYMFYAANGHNAIGRFYETQSARNARTGIVSASPNRDWFRPNPPLDRVLFSLRNNTNLMESGILTALHHVAVNKNKFLMNFYLKSSRSVAKAGNEGPAAWVFPADDPRPGQQADLLNLFVTQGVEIHRATRAFTLGDREYPQGSYIIRMDQPYSRMADMMLDSQYFNINDPRPYDDVGWQLGPLFNAETERVEDLAVLEVPMRMVEGEVTVAGGVRRLGRGRPTAYCINHNADNRLATFFFAVEGIAFEAAEASFTVEEQTFNPGTFIARVDGNPADLEDRLRAAGVEYGFTAWGVNEVPEVAIHPLTRPRVALMHTWQSTQTEGWVRIALDSRGIPYDYISIHEIRDIADLRSRWDAIIFGPSSSDAMSIINGLPMTGDPIPWKRTELTPNIGIEDESDDIRGGMGLEGVIHLRDFLESGGVFITLTSSSALPIHFGLARGVSIVDTPNLWARGSVYRASVTDRNSPIGYGYGDELGVYFSSSPVFSGGFGGGARFQGQGGGGRPSGRGGIDDPDIAQGRARTMGQQTIEEWRRTQLEERDRAAAGEIRMGARGGGIGRARTIVRFASDVDDLLIAGGLANGEELAGSPAVVDATLGEGHVVMFSMNPMWRGETHGSYFFVFNALLHWDHLDAGGR